MSIEQAKIHFAADGTPVSNQYGDVYFNTDSGLKESEDVFIKGNNLATRWASDEEDTFVIGETGFGTGLNFITTWQHFNVATKTDKPSQRRLHYLSFEKYPLSKNDLQQSLAQWSQITDLADLLVAQYPSPLPGCHRLIFDHGKVILDLWLGDIKDTLGQVFHGKSGMVDAWYLDGFTPSKNTDMWSDSVFKSIRTMAKAGSTIATFTCARIVQDGLQSVGYALEKATVFGKKQEVLTGTLLDKPTPTLLPPFYFRHPNQGKKQIAIIGGGIASAHLCFSLAKRGYKVTLYCKDNQLAQGASQNRQGALYPLLHADNSPLSEFYAHAYMYAVRHYQQLIANQFNFEHQFCGVVLQAFNDKIKQRQQTLINCELWPEHLFTAITAEQSSKIASLTLPHSGLYFPHGGWINPSSLIDALLKAANQMGDVEIRLNQEVTSLQAHSDSSWHITTNNNGSSTHSNVVICSGHLANNFSQTQALAISPIRGQVSHLNEIQTTSKLSTVLCYNGYLTPAVNGQHCIGASFIKDDSSTELRHTEHLRNLQRLRNGVGEQDWFDQLTVPDSGKASIRCASVDHLPLVGAVPNFEEYQHSYKDLWKGFKPDRYPLPPDESNLFIFTGLGARGLCSAPLSAEILAAQINNEPYPVSNRILAALNPGRGYIKNLKSKSD
jgi:tRNA 5-methylaminomethyl-2-thiouridine biosynthesis bifunctional protein